MKEEDRKEQEKFTAGFKQVCIRLSAFDCKCWIEHLENAEEALQESAYGDDEWQYMYRYAYMLKKIRTVIKDAMEACEASIELLENQRARERTT